MISQLHEVFYSKSFYILCIWFLISEKTTQYIGCQHSFQDQSCLQPSLLPLLYLLVSVVILYSFDAYSVPQVYLVDKKRNLILSICCTKVLLFLFLDTWDTIRDHCFLLLPSFVLIQDGNKAILLHSALHVYKTKLVITYTFT